MPYDELIKRLRETSVDFGESDHVSVMMIEAADAIEDLITALTASNEVIAKSKPRWIPVTERLPEDEQNVLVAYKTTDKTHLCQYHADGSNNRWYSYIDQCRAYNNVVLAWMPLPEPPKDGES